MRLLYSSLHPYNTLMTARVSIILKQKVKKKQKKIKKDDHVLLYSWMSTLTLHTVFFSIKAERMTIVKAG